MLIEIDFNSDEALYVQLQNQIIMGIAMDIIQLDRRKGAVIASDVDKARALLEMKEQLRILLAKGSCKDISREEVHALVDEIFDEYRKGKTQ